MVQCLNIKTVKIFSRYVVIEMILVFQLSGIFQPPNTEKELAIVWVKQ